MSSVSIGENIKISLFGESHGLAIGGVIDGLPHGQKVDMEKLDKFMARRKPGSGKYVTQRKERDEIKFLSGIKDFIIMGDPLAVIIENNNIRPEDYKALAYTPRPSHIDFSAKKKFGEHIDLSGGGHFSGRLTAILTVFGGIAKQILESKNILVSAHLDRIREIQDTRHNDIENIQKAVDKSENNRYSIINEENMEKIDKVLQELVKEKDSTGGIVECSVFGLSPGVGNPVFDGLENNIAKMSFAIPGVKGIEFGSGFEGALKLGSENNDNFYIDERKEIKTKTNHAGGILGGISSGMPINLKVAFKPTPSIGKEQETVNIQTMSNTRIKIKGRHDPCIAIRGVVVVEAIVSLVVLDYLL